MKFTKSKNDDQLFFVSHNDKKRAVYGTEKHLVEIGFCYGCETGERK